MAVTPEASAHQNPLGKLGHAFHETAVGVGHAVQKHPLRIALVATDLAALGLAADLLFSRYFGPQASAEPTRYSDTLPPPPQSPPPDSGPAVSIVAPPPSSVEAPPSGSTPPEPPPPPKSEIQFKTGVNTPVDSNAAKDLVIAGPENSSLTSIYLSRDPQNNEPVHIKAVWSGDMKVSTVLLGNLLVKHLAITNREGVTADYLFLGDIPNPPKPPANSRPVNEGEDIGTITEHMAIEPRIKALLAQLADYSMVLSFKQNNVSLDAKAFTTK